MIRLIFEGGPTFMFPILFLLILILVLLVLGFLKPNKYEKFVTLVSSVAIFTLAWSVLGMTLGLIAAFDSIQTMKETISQPALMGGLKVVLISPSFGLFTFLIARLGITVLVWKNK